MKELKLVFESDEGPDVSVSKSYLVVNWLSIVVFMPAFRKRRCVSFLSSFSKTRLVCCSPLPCSESSVKHVYLPTDNVP